jgi:polyhydroxybutyrate depolymerase
MARNRRRSATLGIAVLLAFTNVASGCGSGDGESPPPPPPPAASASPSASASPTPSPQSPEMPGPGDHELALDHAGEQMQYEVHAPPTFRAGRKLPLVVVLPYRRADVETMRQMTRLDATADREGFLVAYSGGREDVEGIRAIVGHLVRAWDVDPNRVYATGMSAGAQTAVDLALEAPGVFAAIAPVSGGFLQARPVDDPMNTPRRPVSVVTFFGSQDRATSGFRAGLDLWRERLRCTAGPAVWVDAEKTISRTSARCRDGSDAVEYLISGMGHKWPGSDAGLGDSRVKINATEVIWDFFAAHPRRR